MEELWSTAESLLGPVHCLVNNAGVNIMMIMTAVTMMIFMRMAFGPVYGLVNDVGMTKTMLHDVDDELFR